MYSKEMIEDLLNTTFPDNEKNQDEYARGFRKALKIVLEIIN